ncbi:NAD(P)H-dependent oxidoreductase [Sedimentitalea sp. JM2-8]|uniref:FMN dependent NADH:quinone oxidoreductase n=1 Tax=Sedimentitalea xiamensis TaxID=3050037 RepID=A0ABT7FLR1_9RHOB|nr:NAD(P)H-dependent oxidoreductase [Sedimentitalea xiamensis]MDK3075674.1 NAD(P)H-dependent oxidoreductase [Sedimentitalea xiamensis]
MSQTILQLDSSITGAQSVTRKLTADIVARIATPGGTIIQRDLADGVPAIDGGWFAAVRQAPDQPTAPQQALIDISDAYIDEIRNADTLVIGLPVYNFSVPAQLKNWLDQIARAGVTFRYTEAGPEGLMTGKRAIVAMASGGTAADGPVDFAWPYLRHMLGFIGITDVTLVAADRMAVDAEAAQSTARDSIRALAA